MSSQPRGRAVAWAVRIAECSERRAERPSRLDARAQLAGRHGDAFRVDLDGSATQRLLALGTERVGHVG